MSRHINKILLTIVISEFIVFIGACSKAPETDRGDSGQSLATLLGSRAAGFEVAHAPRAFSFPADHGPHPGFRNEWWYLTGNLEARDGRRFGYELTLFRFRLSPQAPAAGVSAWASHQVYIGHFAITDVANDAFHVAERVARGAAGLAGAEGDPLRVWLYDWSIRNRPLSGDGWQLTAADGDMRLSLMLTAEKEPVLHGDGGLSQKSSAPGNASYYYSIPRLRTSGQLTIDDQQHELTGLSWLDREWSSSALARHQQGWDWFSLQLSDGSDLMFYQLRTADGSRDSYSSGTWMPAAAAPARLGNDDVEIQVLDFWDSPEGGRYPIEWRLDLPDRQLSLRITPVLQNQELSTWLRYWEGAVDVSGSREGNPVSGRGYVEMTGYARSAKQADAP